MLRVEKGQCKLDSWLDLWDSSVQGVERGQCKLDLWDSSVQRVKKG